MRKQRISRYFNFDNIIIFIILVSSVIILILTAGCRASSPQMKKELTLKTTINVDAKEKKGEKKMDFEIQKTEEQWKKELTPEQYRVARQKGTEMPFTGKYVKHDGKGIYKCVACDNRLFSSEHKFDSGTGWPSYYKPLHKDSVKEIKDTSHGMIRTEIVCGKCGAHLGHVFNDGPKPTGLRYCINSCSLDLEEN